MRLSRMHLNWSHIPTEQMTQKRKSSFLIQDQNYLAKKNSAKFVISYIVSWFHPTSKYDKQIYMLHLITSVAGYLSDRDHKI